MYRPSLKTILWTLLVSVTWCASVICLTRWLPVSLQVGEGPSSGKISVEEITDEKTVESSSRSIAYGYLHFWVSRKANNFRFKLYSESGKVSFHLKSISFFGVPCLTSKNLTHFQMEEKLYSTVPLNGEPLEISAKDGSVLGLPNIFPVALRLFRMVTYVLAFAPFLILLAILLCLICWRVLFPAIDRFLKNPMIFGLFLTVGTFLLFPNPVSPAKPGLDESWVWLLNHFALTDSIGRDFVFTYGPLGFVICPQLSFSNVIIGATINILFLAVAMWLLSTLYHLTGTRNDRYLIYLLTIVWFLEWPNGMEWRWSAVGIATMSIAVLGEHIKERTRLLFFAVSALLAVLQSFIKFSNLISVFVQQMVLVSIYAILNRSSSTKGTVVYFGVLIASLLAGSMLLFPSFEALENWVRGSFEIASGYNVYMCVERPPTAYIIPFATVIMIPIIWLIFKEYRMRRAILWIALSPVLFCAYKYSVVRQGVGPLLLLLAWLTVIVSLIMPIFKRNGVVVALICFFVFISMHIVESGNLDIFDLSFNNFIRTFSPHKALAQVRQSEKKTLSCTGLPPDVMREIGTNGIMIVGRDMGPAMCGDLNLVPFPATQDYSAYTAYLENLCIRRLEDSYAVVRFVLVPISPSSIDYRNVCFDNLTLWRYLKDHYEYRRATHDYILLHRREVPDKNDRSAGLPHSCEITRLNLKFGLYDRIVGLIFHLPRIMARICYSDGTTYVCAANPLTLDGAEFPRFIPRMSEEQVYYFSKPLSELPKITSIDFFH